MASAISFIWVEVALTGLLEVALRTCEKARERAVSAIVM